MAGSLAVEGPGSLVKHMKAWEATQVPGNALVSELRECLKDARAEDAQEERYERAAEKAATQLEALWEEFQSGDLSLTGALRAVRTIKHGLVAAEGVAKEALIDRALSKDARALRAICVQNNWAVSRSPDGSWYIGKRRGDL